MVWTKLDDNFPDRPDVARLSRSARLLHIEALVYCNRHLTNGEMPANMLRRISDSETLELDVAELVTVGMWQDHDDGVYEVEWDGQDSAEDVQARKQYRADTQARYRKRKEKHARGDHSDCDPRYCTRSTRDTVTDPVTSNKNGNETPSTPLPSRPKDRDREEDADGSAKASLALVPTGTPHAYLNDGSGSSCGHCYLPESHPNHKD